MKETKPTYSATVFNRQLRKYRLYRQYHTQSQLCHAIGVSRQVYHLWEKGERTPNISQLITLTNLLEVDPGYFFIPRADPEDYDLNIESLRTRIEQNFSKSIADSQKIMPFVETNVARQLFRYLDRCKNQKGLYSISVHEDSGITRSLLQYLTLHAEGIQLFENFNPAENQPDDSALVIIDNADKLPETELKQITETLAREYIGSIVLIGKQMKNLLHNFNLQDKITRHFFTDSITTEGFNRIIQAALPDANENIVNLLRIETGVRLKKLHEMLIKIKEHTDIDPAAPSASTAILEICHEQY